MNKNIIIGIVVVIVILGGGFLLLKGNSMTKSSTANQSTTQPTEAMQPTSQATEGIQLTGTGAMSSNTVSYTEDGFVPSTVTIKKGETVTWTNKDSDDLWVASNPHPTHTDYPGFDELQGISTGKTYSFTFTKVGHWGYHNHLNPSQTGTVVVTE